MLLGISALVSALLSCGVCALTGCFGNLHWLWVLPLGFVVSMGLCALAVLVFLVVICKGVDQTKPQEEDDPFFRRTAYAVIDAGAALARIKIVTSGLEKTPKDGRFLLVCNHLNDIDPPVLLKCFKKSQLAFISKRENDAMFMVGNLMHRLMAQLINRENDREALKTILKCIKLIQEDEVSIAVFPEGYISKNHHLQKLRCGVMKIATKAKVPIAVCTIQGTDKVVGNLKRLRSTPIELHLIDLISVEDQQGRTATDIGEQIYQMMAADLGPDYAPLEAENP